MCNNIGKYQQVCLYSLYWVLHFVHDMHMSCILSNMSMKVSQSNWVILKMSITCPFNPWAWVPINLDSARRTRPFQNRSTASNIWRHSSYNQEIREKSYTVLRSVKWYFGVISLPHHLHPCLYENISSSQPTYVFVPEKMLCKLPVHLAGTRGLDFCNLYRNYRVPPVRTALYSSMNSWNGWYWLWLDNNDPI